VKVIEERVPRDADRSFHVLDYVSDVFSYPWHRHAEYELTWIERGSGQRYVGDSVEAFEPGEVVLLAGGLPHAWLAPQGEAGSCRSVVIQFRRDALGAGFFDLPEMRAVRGLLASSRHGLWFDAASSAGAVGPRMRALTEAAGGRRVAQLVDVLHMLARVADEARRLSSAPFADQRDERDELNKLNKRGEPDEQHWLDALLGTMQERYREPLSLDDLAAAVHRSPSAVSRGFRKAMGCTVVMYLHQLRVAEACRLLVHSQLPITGVAHAAGFHNLAHFGRVFKRETGQTPRGFRRSAGRSDGGGLRKR